MSAPSLLQRLSAEPVLGVSMGCVSLLRLDLTGGLAPGNKIFKLQPSLVEARERGIGRLLTFGGAWSNHLHAVAAIGARAGLETVGIVRGEVSATPSATLVDARGWGMQLVNVSRAEYRRRGDPEYLSMLRQRYGECLVIPEGGAGSAGVTGCTAIARLLLQYSDARCRVVLPVGTGTTLAGLVVGLGAHSNVVGISVLKGAQDLDGKVAASIAGISPRNNPHWRILHDHHCGGYAKVSSQLKAFMLDFERVHEVPLDPVYTGKALFGVHQMLRAGQWRGETIAIHTGGLQGRRGFSWLSP